MTSERPYREAMSAETAYVEIERGKGNQFDPEVARAFLKISATERTNVDTSVKVAESHS